MEVMKRVVWQPFGLYQPGFDFGIYLDAAFVKEMAGTKIAPTHQGNMQRLGYETLQRLGGISRTPYDFLEDTALVRGFHLGVDGRWLTTEAKASELMFANQTDTPVEFHSHNIDTLHQQRRLLALVDQWVEYAPLLIE